MRFFFGTLKNGLFLLLIPSACLMTHRVSFGDHSFLALNFVKNRVLERIERADIFKLHFRAHIKRDIRFKPKLALFHAAARGAEIAKEKLKFAREFFDFGGGRKIRLGDKLHERSARAVKIDQ